MKTSLSFILALSSLVSINSFAADKCATITIERTDAPPASPTRSHQYDLFLSSPMPEVQGQVLSSVSSNVVAADGTNHLKLVAVVKLVKTDSACVVSATPIILINGHGDSEIEITSPLSPEEQTTLGCAAYLAAHGSTQTEAQAEIDVTIATHDSPFTSLRQLGTHLDVPDTDGRTTSIDVQDCAQ